MAQGAVIVAEKFLLLVRQLICSSTDRRARDYAIQDERVLNAGNGSHHTPATLVESSNLLEARTEFLVDVGQLVVARPADAPRLLPFARQAVGGAGDHADRRRVVQQMIAPSFAKPPEQAVTRAIHFKNEHRVADVYSEFAGQFVMQRGLRVIADHAARRRDFDAAHPGQPAQVFDDARTDVRRLALGVDVGVVVKKYRQTAVRRFDQTGDVALEEANYIAFGEVFDGQRRDHRRVRAQLNRGVQVVEDLRPRGTVHPDPGLYGSRIEDGGWRMEDRVGRSILDPRSSILDPRSSPLSVDAANFVDF